MASIDNVQDISPRVQYTAAAAQTAFDFPFPIFVDTDIAIDVSGTTLALGTDYTVTGAGNDHGGTVTFLVGRTVGQIVTIYRQISIERTSDFQQNGPLNSVVFNDELDRMTLVEQQLASQIGRAMRMGPTDLGADTDQILPSKTIRAGKFLAFDAAGKPTVSNGTGPDGSLRADLAAAGTVLVDSSRVTPTDATRVTYARTAAEIAAAVTPTAFSYLPYTPRRYGAVGDGTTDDSVAWQKAFTACPAGGTIVGYIGDNYKANTLHITKSVIIDLNGCTMTSTAYASGMSRKIFYALTADAVGFVTIKNGRLNGVGTNRGATAAEQESLIWLDTVGTVLLRDLEVFGHAAGIQTIPPALKDRILSAVFVRFPTLNCTFDNVTVHDNWNEQLAVHNSSGSTCFCEAVNCKSYLGQNNPANTPLEITGGYASIRGCHFYSGNASIINLQANLAAEVIGNTLINNASTNSQGYGVNCGQDGVTGYVNNVTIADNIIESTMQGGISVMGSNVKVVNNTIRNSGSVALASGAAGIKARAVYNAASFASLLPDYPAQPHQDLVDLLIEGNTINDTVFTNSITGTAIHVEMTDNAWSGANYTGFWWRRVTIRNNSIRQPTITGANQLQNGITVSYAFDTIVEGNYIHDANNNSILVSGNVENLKISRNKFSATSYNSQVNSTILFFNFNTLQTLTFNNVTIEENVFSSFPTPGNFDVAVDTTSGAASPVVTGNFRFINNQGMLMGIGGSGISTANYSYRKDDYPMQTATPSTAGTTFNQYDVVPAKPLATGVQGWVNVNPAGTLGTLNAGATTGGITINTTILTVNSATGLVVGQVISVAGAITSAIVANISGTTVTLTAKATATVAAAAVAFVNPLFKTIGSVGA